MNQFEIFPSLFLIHQVVFLAIFSSTRWPCSAGYPFWFCIGTRCVWASWLFFFFLAQVHFYLSPQPEHSSVPWSCSSSPKGNVPQSLDVVQAERVCASITSGKLVSFMLSWVDPISLHWLFITISRYPGLHHFKPFGFNDWILPFPLSVHWL